MERCCPDAWLINFTNPAGLITEALLRFGRKKVLGLCNVPIELHMDLAEVLHVDASEIELDWVGLNHLGWVRHIWVNGQDRLPEIIERYETGELVDLAEIDYPPGFISALGMLPSYYLRFFYAPERILADLKSSPKTRAEVVSEIEVDLFDLYRDPQEVTLPELLKQRGGAWYSRLAIQVIHALYSEEPTIHIVNTTNGDTFPELPRDASIEVPCEISKNGVNPLPTRAPEDSIIGLIRQVKAYERLTIEAAVEHSSDKAYLALMANPLVPNAATAHAIFEVLKTRQHI